MKKIFFLTLLTMLTTACIDKVDTPKQVAEKYRQAIQAGDHESAKQLVSKNTQHNFDEYTSLPKEQKIAIGSVELGETQSSVSTSIRPTKSPSDDPYTLDTILSLENGHWKIDASRTQPPPTHTTDQQLEELAKQLSDSMQDNVETMDDALTEGMEILNQTMKDGSKEMGESLLKLMDELNQTVQDSVDEMKQRRQDNSQQPDPTQGEGMI